MVWAKQQIAKETVFYDVELMASYGYYRLLEAKDDSSIVKLGLNIIQLTTAYYYNATLQMERASAYKIGGMWPWQKNYWRRYYKKSRGWKLLKKLY